MKNLAGARSVVMRGWVKMEISHVLDCELKEKGKVKAIQWDLGVKIEEIESMLASVVKKKSYSVYLVSVGVLAIWVDGCIVDKVVHIGDYIVASEDDICVCREEEFNRRFVYRGSTERQIEIEKMINIYRHNGVPQRYEDLKVVKVVQGIEGRMADGKYMAFTDELFVRVEDKNDEMCVEMALGEWDAPGLMELVRKNLSRAQIEEKMAVAMIKFKGVKVEWTEDGILKAIEKMNSAKMALDKKSRGIKLDRIEKFEDTIDRQNQVKKVVIRCDDTLFTVLEGDLLGFYTVNGEEVFSVMTEMTYITLSKAKDVSGEYRMNIKELSIG